MGELNLIPYNLKENKNKKFQFRQYIALGIIIIAIIFGAIYYPYYRLNSLRKQEQSLKTQLNNGKNIIQEGEALKKEISELNEYIGKAELLTKEKLITSVKLRGIEKLIPPSIALKELNYSDSNKMVLIGRTKNYNAISEFGANLRVSKDYPNAKINNISFDKDKVEYTFTLTIEGIGGNIK